MSQVPQFIYPSPIVLDIDDYHWPALSKHRETAIALWVILELFLSFLQCLPSGFSNCHVSCPQCIPYSVLLKDLEMRNLRELEDLIIEAVYTDIIQGKLDQRNQLLEVDFCIGRDIRKKDINNIVKTLHEW